MSIIKSKKFGHFLQLRRTQVSLSQTDVAKHVGTTAQYISNIESGRAATPHWLISDLKKMYKIRREELLGLLCDVYKSEWRKL